MVMNIIIVIMNIDSIWIIYMYMYIIFTSH